MNCLNCTKIEKLKIENEQLRQLLTTAFRKSNLGSGRSNKYNNKHIRINNHTFDSKREYFRYLELLDLQRKKIVSFFEVHPRFDLVVDGNKMKKYEADFRVYWTNGNVTVEDCKGVRTPLYKLKKSLMKSIYDIDICEI